MSHDSTSATEELTSGDRAGADADSGPQIPVHVAVIHHAHGHDVYVAENDEKLTAKIVKYVEDSLGELNDEDQEDAITADFEQGKFYAGISAYFTAMDGEYMDEYVLPIAGRPA